MLKKENKENNNLIRKLLVEYLDKVIEDDKFQINMIIDIDSKEDWIGGMRWKSPGDNKTITLNIIPFYERS